MPQTRNVLFLRSRGVYAGFCVHIHVYTACNIDSFKLEERKLDQKPLTIPQFTDDV